MTTTTTIRTRSHVGRHRAASTHATLRRSLIAAAGITTVAAVGAPPASAVEVPVPGTGDVVEIPVAAVDAAASQFTETYRPQIDAVSTAAGQAGITLPDLDVALPAAGETTPATPVSKSASVGQQIADAALSKQGSPYAWGAAGPEAFDCSGLTSWAHAQVGKTIPRTSGAQAGAGTSVSLSNLQPGDVITYYASVSHVAIYIGGGQVVHAVNESTPVQVNDLNYMPVNSAVRF
ncbi:C40 family peptidase [Corynebacterium sp. AOP12-C2-36]|uniref:C40 family peptidase n=1 Tax=Corynebacterium sp. AOP12-C2-36 TaxID=3457723 RepID=UPI004034F2BB